MTEPTTAAEHDRIRAVIEGALRALGAKDAEATLAHYAPGFVHYSLAPPLRSSLDAQALAGWFATWRGEIGHEVRDLEIVSNGDVAYCTSLNRMTGTKTDGEQVDLWYRATIGLRRIGGGWRIAHEHESVPFYMDGSYRAAVDLKP
jgi:ketosteroid isomerase-like protein